jgi:hypothetical protein
MKTWAFALAAVLHGSAFGYVFTNVGEEHKGLLDHNIIYAQSGGTMSIHTCAAGQAPSLTDCKVTRSLSASQFNAALAMPAPFSPSGEPMIAEELRNRYIALLSDNQAHNLRLATEDAFEDQSVSTDLAFPLLLTPSLLGPK